MKFWQALLMNAAVVGGGLFAYDRVSGPRGSAASSPADALSEAAMARFEKQYDEIMRRRGSMSPRRARIALYVDKMKLSLDKAAERRLVQVLDGFQDARVEFWERTDAKAPGYDAKYRAFVDSWIAKVGPMLPKSEADTVVSRFIFDGRIIKPPEAGKPGK